MVCQFPQMLEPLDSAINDITASSQPRPTNINSLGRLTLSIVLSYLHEAEGVRLLTTQSTWTRDMLPLYRITPSKIDVGTTNRQRYHFAAVPVEDVSVLLARLNTARLFLRQRGQHQESTTVGRTTVQLAHEEWQYMLRHPLSTQCWRDPTLELLQLPSSSGTSSASASRANTATVLVSYPRSGNTLARHLLERTTGIVTGSDTHPNRPLSRQLAQLQGLVGEGDVTASNHLCIIKSHWPERRGWKSFSSKKSIVLVRNPYDAIDSYWNMNATLSHTKRLTDSMYTVHADQWHGLVRNEIRVWQAFLEFWLLGEEGDHGRNRKCCCLVVRYEDLVRDPYGQVCRMMRFILGEPLLSEFWKARVRHATASFECVSSTIGKSLPRYTPELLEYIKSVEEETAATSQFGDSRNFIRRFGYSIDHQDFPRNFQQQGREPVLDNSNGDFLFDEEPCSSVVLNVGPSIRPPTCRYGRSLRDWRRSLTNNDTEPFPTVKR